MNYCPDCGTKSVLFAKFCHECGYRYVITTIISNTKISNTQTNEYIKVEDIQEDVKFLDFAKSKGVPDYILREEFERLLEREGINRKSMEYSKMVIENKYVQELTNWIVVPSVDINKTELGNLMYVYHAHAYNKGWHLDHYQIVNDEHAAKMLIRKIMMHDWESSIMKKSEKEVYKKNEVYVESLKDSPMYECDYQLHVNLNRNPH